MNVIAVLRRWCGLSLYVQIPHRPRFVLSVTLFACIILLYLGVAYRRHAMNPGDKIVPTPTAIQLGVERMAQPDEQGDIPWVVDTIASVRRFTVGASLSFCASLLIGIVMALYPIVDALLFRFIVYMSKIPPLALLPILFILSGLGEFTKILIIIVGVTPVMAADIYFRVKQIPEEHIVKALTLGAHSRTIVSRVVLPQILPEAITSLRLQLLNIWLFLIASEAIASTEGLGYRIFLVRRYLAMDIIIPYVLWIAVLSFAADAALAWWVDYRYPWYHRVRV